MKIILVTIKVISISSRISYDFFLEKNCIKKIKMLNCCNYHNWTKIKRIKVMILLPLRLNHLLLYISEYPSSHPLVKNIAVFNITKKERYQILISIRVCDSSECTPLSLVREYVYKSKLKLSPVFYLVAK